MHTMIVQKRIQLKYTAGVALIIAAVAILTACNGNGKKAVTKGTAESIEIKYARGFSVSETADGVRLIEVSDPQGSDSDDERMPIGYQFALVPHGWAGTVPTGYTRVEVPISRTICMTALQLSNFTALDAHGFIRGITGTKNLYDTDILSRVDRGDIVKIGMEGEFDTELVMAANPDVIFISPFKRGGYDAIKETGITLVPHLGYKELDPLGQAEWIKFVALFLGKEAEADSVFAGIERRYNDLKATTSAVETRPTVFSGEMHGGNWYAVGGRNHLAQLFRDAGADYIFKNEETGGVNIEYEQMYAVAANADYWRILNSFKGDFSYEALQQSEPRNALFAAFRNRHVIYCNMRQTPYYELSPVKPDILLADLINIFHPELMPPDYQPTFYTLLK